MQQPRQNRLLLAIYIFPPPPCLLLFSSIQSGQRRRLSSNHVAPIPVRQSVSLEAKDENGCAESQRDGCLYSAQIEVIYYM
jgi:hypothetical protein